LEADEKEGERRPLGVATILGFLTACAAGAVIGSISYRTYRPRIIDEILNPKKDGRRIEPPSESEKHRLLLEIFRRIDDISEGDISPAARYFLKKARNEGTAAIYSKAETVFDDLQERIHRNPAGASLNETGLYRTALRVAILGIAEDEIAEMRSEVLSWGFDELAPIAGADLDFDREDSVKASKIAVPLSFA
jgi:hypothetical protein